MSTYGVILSRALAAALLSTFAAPCAAQVLEVNTDGSVVVYSAPATFNADSVQPIARSSARGRASAPEYSGPAPQAAVSAAAAAEVSPRIIEAIAWRESRFRPGVVSRAGAVGEMQLMPATARALGVDPYDSRQNYLGGATYFAGLMRRYDGDVVKSLAAYNAGPGAVDRYHGVPPFKETRAYVADILNRLSLPASPGFPIANSGPTQ